MSYQDFRNALARLRSIAATREAAIRADPIPFLSAAAKQMADMHEVLRRVETALSDTDWVFDEATAAGIQADHYKADTQRVSRAREVLADYFRG